MVLVATWLNAPGESEPSGPRPPTREEEQLAEQAKEQADLSDAACRDGLVGCLARALANQAASRLEVLAERARERDDLKAEVEHRRLLDRMRARVGQRAM